MKAMTVTMMKLFVIITATAKAKIKEDELITALTVTTISIGLMHDVLLIIFTAKPCIQNANVFPKNRN